MCVNWSSNVYVALLVAGLALSGCCVSGTGCSAPVITAPIAWDGLGEAPTGSAEPSEVKRPKRRTARDHEIIVGPLNDAPLPTEAKARYDDWTRLPNEDPEADAKLARQLKICRNC
jgi:hypothetical protein